MNTSYSYDPLNRLTNLQSTCGAAGSTGCAGTCGTAAPGCALASYAYILGTAGNRLSVQELNGRTVQYAYDDLYRLTSETIAGAAAQNGAVSYQYDAVGNRKQLTSTVAAIPVTGLLNYDANDRISTQLYDNNGNTVNNGTLNVYDFENSLVQRSHVHIVYDGDGNRVSETVGGATVSYLVADVNPTGYPQVVQERQNQFGPILKNYQWGLQLIAEGDLSQPLHYYGMDGHGSVRYLTDANGAITDTYDYDAFGNLIAQTGTTANNYLFAGEQFDPSLGVYYNRARYFDQRLGRYWTADTFAGRFDDPQSLHKYLYANANPVNKTDPSGFFSIVEESEAAAESEELDSLADVELQSVRKKLFNTKISDIYFVIGPSDFRSIGPIPIVHAFLYADTIGTGEGIRYDVGLDNPATFASAIFGVQDGFVQRSPAALSEIKSEPFTFTFKIASLSALQRVEWEAAVQALPIDTDFVDTPYSITNIITGTNCIKWSILAAFPAVVAGRIGN